MSEPSLRRLGVGGGGGGGDRPIRAQLVVALTASVILIAVPLYLMRRPSGAASGADATVAAAETVPSALPPTAPLLQVVDAAVSQPERVRLGPVQQVKCSASVGAKGQEGSLCDRLPIFEEALAKAIRESVDCAPKTGKTGTLNYLMGIDFRRRRVTLTPGASGQWKGPQATRAANCVRRALPAPEWEAIRHQYNFYYIAILATYPDPSELVDPNAPPSFE